MVGVKSSVCCTVLYVYFRNPGNKTLSECGEEWTDSPNGDSCYLLQKEMLTWSVAEDNCTKVGAHLLSIDNAREQGYITGSISIYISLNNYNALTENSKTYMFAIVMNNLDIWRILC